jgi:hypothetical protein
VAKRPEGFGGTSAEWILERTIITTGCPSNCQNVVYDLPDYDTATLTSLSVTGGSLSTAYSFPPLAWMYEGQNNQGGDLLSFSLFSGGNLDLYWTNYH